MDAAMKESLLASVHSTVFKESETLEGKCIKIEGYDFNRGVDYRQLLRSMVSTGFQASNLGEAIGVVNQMVTISSELLFNWGGGDSLAFYCCCCGFPFF